MMPMPSLAFWEEPQEEGAAPRLVQVEETAPIPGPHCKWCAINLNHPNCVLNADDAAHPCPDCRYDPVDVTAHQGWCPRIGTTGNDGPNFTDPPWSVDDPGAHEYLVKHCTEDHIRKLRYQSVTDIIFIAMSGHSRVWLPEGIPGGEQEELVSWWAERHAS